MSAYTVFAIVLSYMPINTRAIVINCFRECRECRECHKSIMKKINKETAKDKEEEKDERRRKTSEEMKKVRIHTYK